MKKAIVLGVIVICTAFTVFYPHAMISPGELLAAHHSLNKKCQSCHTPFSGISNRKCVSCHQLSEIGKDSLGRKDTGKLSTSFHQYLAEQNCTSCHTEHKGQHPDVFLTKFNHHLLAANTMNQCGNCHQKPADKVHQQVSASCKGCHTTDGWKFAATFDHSLITGTDQNNCASCHQKPNDGYHQLITDGCNKCHTTAKWSPSSFDHSAYFRLDRNHNTACNTCHANNNLTSYTCYGCHAHSESRIIAEHNEEGIYNISKCASCHKSGNGHDIQNRERDGEKEGEKVREFIKSQGKNDKNRKEEDDDD